MNNGHGCLLVSLKNDNVELKSHLRINPRRKRMNKFNTSKVGLRCHCAIRLESSLLNAD